LVPGGIRVKAPASVGSEGVSNGENGLDGFRRLAESETIFVSVTEGESITVPVQLNPITGEDYKGTFVWNIGFVEGSRITGAEMRIWEYANRYDAVGTVNLFDTNADNYIVLPTGEYWVVITLGSDNPMVGGEFGKVLRVYYNMYSAIEDWEFGNVDLSASPLGLILLAWDGNEWDFSAPQAWDFADIGASSFAVAGVAGVNEWNFGYIENAFNDIAYWNEPFSVPDNVDQLRQLVDAALINAGTGEHFRNNALLYQSGVLVNIEAMVQNGSHIEFEWTDDYNTLIVEVGDEDEPVYVVVIDFGRTIPLLPPLTGTVSIIGNAVVGQTLTANTVGLGGTGAIAFQWRRGDTDIAGAIWATYSVQIADGDSTITVRVTRANNSGSVTSAPTDTVVIPPLTGVVGITGTLREGQTLTANTAGLGGSGTISFQWMRGTEVVGTGNTHNVQAADEDSIFTLRVSRANNEGYVTSFPMLTGTLSIDGNAHVGQVLTVNTDNLGSAGNVTFQWRRGNVNILWATGATYTVQTADLGSIITVIVTGTENSGSITSTPTAAVILPPLPGTVSITGYAEVGETLTADIDDLGGTGTIVFQWMRGDTNIAGATGSTYTVQLADAGYPISVRVTRTGNFGSVTSAPTDDVIIPPLTGTVSITGYAHVGLTLTANTAGLGGTGIIAFQWKRGGTNIAEATGTTYTVQHADVGSTITVTVTRTGNVGSVTSTPTDTVIIPPLTGTVEITGTLRAGQTLIANTVGLGGTGAISHQWMRVAEVVGTGNTYTVQAADVDTLFTLRVSRANNQGYVTSFPMLTGTVGVTGNAHVGQTLTANTDDLGGIGDIAFQWRRGVSNIVGATGATYTVQTADVGSTITVVATRTGNSGNIIIVG